jgi:uncharacterized protein YicC (UPF0701 family)
MRSRKNPGNISEEYRQRLTKRITELLAKTESQIELDQGRLAQEIAYLADRADISKRSPGLRTHLEHFRSIMDEEKEVGQTPRFSDTGTQSRGEHDHFKNEQYDRERECLAGKKRD